tara:strand:+ start:809 stop:1174 length:366 start_codon:yes stop_codon:yes gene_type:complete
MYELLWFIGGAITYQLLSRILKVAQLYIFFQEVHMHALLMLDAAAQDIETAQEIKASLIKECDLEKGDAELIDLADRESIRLWKTTTVIKLQRAIPNAFKTEMQYNTWAELENYLKQIKKR